MVQPAYGSRFARLDLSADEQENLRRTAATLIDAVQTKYEHFLNRDFATVSTKQWDLVKEREDVRVFHDRRPGAGTDNRHMHALLTFGSIVGTLNDVLYGEMSHTSEAMRAKTVYSNDTLLDCAVLASVLDPTTKNPFQSLAVRWFVRGVPLHMRLVAKNGDAVYLEAMGMRQLSNGERVGYRLMHSVSFAATPTLPDYERFNLSNCVFWRELPSFQRVQVYGLTHLEINEKFWVVPTIIKGECARVGGESGRVQRFEEARVARAAKIDVYEQHGGE